MTAELITHLIELRKRLVYAIVGFALALIALFPMANQLYLYLAQPLNRLLPQAITLIATDIAAPVFVPLKLAAISAMLISLPNSVYQLWQFIAPGLYRHERKLLISLIVSSFGLFISGILFCYWLVLPTFLHFVIAFKAPQITMLTDMDKYLSFVLNLFSIFGIAFETPIVVFLLLKFNILSIEQACNNRKYVLVSCFILAAIVTPPDVLSQTLLAIPLYLLYELGLAAGKIALRPPAST